MKKKNTVASVFLFLTFSAGLCQHSFAQTSKTSEELKKMEEMKVMNMQKDESGKMKDEKMMQEKTAIDKMMPGMQDIATWPMSLQMAVREQMTLYGKPTEMTSTMAIWYNNGPWNKTVISKMDTKHDFPKSHMDCMMQCVSFKVPVDMYDGLGKFDGSVTVDRTQGMLAARCDKEENNFLALNLAYDIIMKKKTVEEARKAYGEMIMMAIKGNKPEYMQKLMFSSNTNAPDPDMNTIKM